MFRVRKALNHNTLIAISMDDNQEYLLIGKGIGFGKKVSERFEIPENTECTVYSLQEQTERGKAIELIKGKLRVRSWKKVKKFLERLINELFSQWREVKVKYERLYVGKIPKII